jgi:hypothetical protein
LQFRLLMSCPLILSFLVFLSYYQGCLMYIVLLSWLFFFVILSLWCHLHRFHIRNMAELIAFLLCNFFRVFFSSLKSEVKSKV